MSGSYSYICDDCFKASNLDYNILDNADFLNINRETCEFCDEFNDICYIIDQKDFIGIQNAIRIKNLEDKLENLMQKN